MILKDLVIGFGIRAAGATFGLLALVAVLATPVRAQDDTRAAMAQVIRQTREAADRMQGQLPPEDIAEMRRSADELERELNNGAFDGPVYQERESVSARLQREHGGITDWLENETACAGYSWETYKVYRLDTGDRDAERDVLCQRAYAHMADYFLMARDAGQAHADAALEAYDRAAHAAVDFYERR